MGQDALTMCLSTLFWNRCIMSVLLSVFGGKERSVTTLRNYQTNALQNQFHVTITKACENLVTFYG
jgi:hypothetical protein